jgi:catechol 2,3-dioxygenase-like lactoylglutathione lyase family enzyme
MLPILRLYEIAIPVRQLERAEKFYTEILGLRVGLRDTRRRWIFLRAGKSAGMVVLQEQATDFPSVHFAFEVDDADLERAARMLDARGVAIGEPIFHDWIPGRSLYFHDSEGHELELFAPSPAAVDTAIP